MTIGIDAHNLEGKRTGVGRYVFNLLKEWSTIEFLQFCHTTEYDRIVKNENDPLTPVKFVLYFKDEIPADLPRTDFFECKLLKVGSTAKFMNWDLARVAAKNKVDILFCPDYRAPIWYQGRTAITLHDINYEAHPESFNWQSSLDRVLLKWASKKTAKKASVIFTPSEFSRQEVMKYYGVPGEKIITTLLAADPFQFEKFDSPAYGTDAIKMIKKKYGVKDKFIFYVGSIFVRRHLPEVIASFEQLAQENSDYQFLIGGRDYTGGKSVDKLAKNINAKLGREAVLRVDFIAEDGLRLVYSACAFFIWLSDYEGFGLPPLEAMSLGAPVITTDGSSLSEVAGDAALLIKDNLDVKEIYRAMHKLTRDSILREELIVRGKERVKRFSWKDCAEKTLEKLLSLSLPEYR